MMMPKTITTFRLYLDTLDSKGLDEVRWIIDHWNTCYPKRQLSRRTLGAELKIKAIRYENGNNPALYDTFNTLANLLLNPQKPL